MNISYTAPLKEFRGHISDISSRFILEEPIVVDPNSGIMHMPEGFARLVYHQPTETVNLLFSKDARNLHGVENLQGSVNLSSDGLSHSYHVAGYRLKGSLNGELNGVANLDSARHLLIEDLRKFRAKHRERMRRHFTLFGAKVGYSHLDLKTAGINVESDTYIFTNGRIVYVIDETRNGQYTAKLHLPTRRNEGSFAPFNLTDKGLKGWFNKVSSNLGSFNSFEEAREAVHQNWGLMSATLWDERSIFEDLSLRVKTMAEFKTATDRLSRDALKRAATIAGVGTFFFVLKPEYTWIGAIGGAAVHTAADFLIEHAYEHGEDRLRESRKKPAIENYEFGENVTDYFRIQNKREIAKLCAHIDAERIGGLTSFEPVPYDIMSLDNKGMTTGPYKMAGDVRELLTFMHQRGISSDCSFLDDYTALNSFQNGVVRLMQRNPEDSECHFYVTFKEEQCVNPALALPEYYAATLRGQIFHFTYNRETGVYSDLEVIPDVSDLTKEAYKRMMFRSIDSKPDLQADALKLLAHAFGSSGTYFDLPTTENLGAIPEDRAAYLASEEYLSLHTGEEAQEDLLMHARL